MKFSREDKDLLEDLADVARAFDAESIRTACEKFRETVIRQRDRLAIGADALRLFLQTRGKSIDLNAKRWREFLSFADDVVDRNARHSTRFRQLRAAARLTAVWGAEILDHYGFTSWNFKRLESLAKCAEKVPDFLDFVLVANVTLLERHEKSLTSNKSDRIGQHSLPNQHTTTSTSPGPHQPLQNKDVRNVLEFLERRATWLFKESTCKEREQLLTHSNRIDEWVKDEYGDLEVADKRLKEHHRYQAENYRLGYDRYGLLVPRDCEAEKCRRDRTRKRQREEHGGTGKEAAAGASRRHTRGQKRTRTSSFFQYPSPPTSLSQSRHVSPPSESTDKGNKYAMSMDSAHGLDITESPAFVLDEPHSPAQPRVSTPRNPYTLSQAQSSPISFLSPAPGYCEFTTSSEADSPYTSQPGQDLEVPGAPRICPNNEHEHMASFRERSSLEAEISPSPQAASEFRCHFVQPENNSFQLKSPCALQYMASPFPYEDNPDTATSTRSFSPLVNCPPDASNPLASTGRFDATSSGFRSSSSSKLPVDCTQDVVSEAWLKLPEIQRHNRIEPFANVDEDDKFYVATPKQVQDAVSSGFKFRKPIVTKYKFLDSQIHTPEKFATDIRSFHAKGTFQVRYPNGQLRQMAAHQLAKLVEQQVHEPYNVLDIRAFNQAHMAPVLLNGRFRLLDALLERSRRYPSPGKEVEKEPHAIADSLHFDILGFPGAFSGPHVDNMIGTQLRMLFGKKRWMVVLLDELSDEERAGFARAGPTWCPPTDKGQLVRLEEDDVLLMPPGVKVIHAVYTDELALMEGSMLWDFFAVIEIIHGLHFVAEHPICTNEPIAPHLTRILDELEHWVREEPEKFTNGDREEFQTKFQNALADLKALSCDCHSCRQSHCRCETAMRRCTTWCHNHGTKRTCVQHDPTLL